MEVVDVMLTEYDEEAVMNMLREEAREEGIGIGREEGLEEGINIGARQTQKIFKMSQQGKSIEEIAKTVNKSVEYVREILYGEEYGL